MELRRLNDNQIRFRLQKTISAIGDVCADQCWTILEQAGVVQRLRDGGLLGGDGAGPQKPQSLDELAERALQHGLERADAQVMRIWEERKARADAVQAFNVSVNVTPYTIADTSIAQIVMEADAPVVLDIWSAMIERSRSDGCNDVIVRRMEEVSEGWNAWAKTGLKPRKRLQDQDADADA